MADSRFFDVAGPFSLKDLAKIAEGSLSESADGDAQFNDVAPLGDAGASHISFLDNRKYIESYTQSSAGACIVHPALAAKAPEGMHLILMEDPYRG